MNIAWGLGIARGPVARLHAPGLEVAADGARGNLAEGILAGQRAIPTVLENAGFRFRHNTIGEALDAALVR